MSTRPANEARPPTAGFFVFRRVGAFLLLAGFLLALPAATADENQRQTRETAFLSLVASVHENLARIREENPNDVHLAAAEYLRLFAAFPETEQGKLAGIEVYLLFRNARMDYQALGQAERLIKTYGPEETMPNLADPARPLALVVSMRIESARTLMDLGDPLGAVERLRGIPPREVHGMAGLVNGEKTYYGPARALVALGIVDGLLAAGESQQAYLALQQLLRVDGGVATYREKREGALDRDLLDRVEAIARAQGWDLARTAVEVGRLRELLRSDLARIRLEEILAEAYLDRFAKAANRPDALAARDLLVGVALRFGAVTENEATPEGVRVLRTGERMLDRVERLYIETLKDPDAWGVHLGELANRLAGDPPLAARVELMMGDHQFRRAHNAAEALRRYRNVMERYGDLVYYPHVLPEVPRYGTIARDRIAEVKSWTGEP